MEKKVESRKQSGGITAENVNITHNHKHVTVKKNDKKKNNTLKTIATIIAIVVGLITIITYVTNQHGNPPYSNDKGHQIQPTRMISNH